MTTFIALKFLSYLASPMGVFVAGLVAGAVSAVLRFRRLARLIAGLALAQWRKVGEHDRQHAPDACPG